MQSLKGADSLKVASVDCEVSLAEQGAGEAQVGTWSFQGPEMDADAAPSAGAASTGSKIAMPVLPTEPVSQDEAFSRVPQWFQGNGECKLLYAAREGYGKRQAHGGIDSPGGYRSTKVLLSVYDLAGVVNEEGKAKLNPFVSKPLAELWHINMYAFGHGYDNPRQVDGILTMALSPWLFYQYELPVVKTEREFQFFLVELRKESRHQLDKYHMETNNCNHFQADCLEFLTAPGTEVNLVTALEVLSPVRFDVQKPSASLNKLANIIVMRGMQDRMVDIVREKEEEARRMVLFAAALTATALGGWAVFGHESISCDLDPSLKEKLQVCRDLAAPSLTRLGA